jgi:hypothetical protein
VEKVRFSMKTSKRTYSQKYHSGMYSPEPRCTVHSVIGNFIFINRLIAPISLLQSCFSRNRTNDRYFLSIRGYGASRESHEGAL